ncbi:hypothetical protein Cgig2_015226 [Carnegiea gigantea]|uniref:Uncharacterized protein n=1 Tax=Carnegiea gigantea TaxID=171969 RepID=A0A9Q1GRC4_9CARY|nr:hypothetical protein Cgig2_015226 [Carnegiea gigantea]
MTNRGIHPSGRSGIIGEEGGQRTIYTPFSAFSMSFPPLYNTREMADYVRESLIWRWRRATRPPCSLPEDYHVLCPHFSLPEAEGAAANLELPEMVLATFYAILLNEVVELGLVYSFMAKGLKSALVGLRWDPLAPGPRLLPPDYHGRCPCFDLEVATRYARDSNTPEMVPIIFYAKAAEYVRDNLRWSVREISSLRLNLLPLHFTAYYPEVDHIVAMQFAHAAHIPEMV